MSYDKPSIDDVIMHYGMNHLKSDPGSGRYEFGSGDNPYQHSFDFLAQVKAYRSGGRSFTDMREYLSDGKKNPDYGKTFTGETAVAKMMGMSTNEYRQALTYHKNIVKMEAINRAQAYVNAVDENGNRLYSMNEIAKKMGLPNESSVRSLLKPSVKANIEKTMGLANSIEDIIKQKAEKDPKAMLDIGPGVENELNVTRTRLDNAIYILENERGYKTFGGRNPNVTDPTGARQTTMNAVGMPNTTWNDFYDRVNNHIYSMVDYISRDGGESLKAKFQYPESMDSSRILVRYAEEGGLAKDGLVELRRNVPDLSLGEKNYAQVRILVDGDKYIKGMAAYAPDQTVFPKGIDLIFNSNKKLGTPLDKVFKEVKRNPDGSIDIDNPFGSLIKDKDQGGQYEYTDSNGKTKLGLINKRADEGDWDNWKDTLSSQFLSKQPVQLAKRQLNLAIVEKQQEFNDIMALTNNTIKKHYLESFASDCDSAAVHLTAAALPRQKFQVILPIPSLKDTEIFAPNYDNGEQVALVRYPHGGTFEIPILKVNNKNKEGLSMIGTNSRDAVGINPSAAARLSGADFDGDTVMVVPLGNKIKIDNNKGKPLLGLEGFEPKIDYGPAKFVSKNESSDGKDHAYNADGLEYKLMSKRSTQKEMGEITNLISDMTLIGAPPREIAKAVRHSMVVIDAEKHHLDYQSSYIQNDIALLKKRYQAREGKNGREAYGAATLLTRAKSEERVPKRQGQPKPNIKGTSWYDPTRPEGALIYKTDPKASYVVTKTNKKTGEVTETINQRTQSSYKMAEVDDARQLISKYNTPMEQVYASFANTMKSLANQARKANYFTENMKYNASAAKKYATEVKELENEVVTASKNKPRERQAQLIATSNIKIKKAANPGMTKEDGRKLSQKELTKARALVGATRKKINITDKQWEAIQAGAIHASTLKKILQNADADKLRERATPSNRKVMTESMQSRAKAYANAGKTNAEIAAILGVSASTISKYVSGDDKK